MAQKGSRHCSVCATFPQLIDLARRHVLEHLESWNPTEYAGQTLDRRFLFTEKRTRWNNTCKIEDGLATQFNCRIHRSYYILWLLPCLKFVFATASGIESLPDRVAFLKYDLLCSTALVPTQMPHQC